jgi:hypothetical protein
MQMKWRKILSEYPYKKYKDSFLFRLKTVLKILLIKNKKNKSIDYSKYKYLFYIKDFGHLSRALEFKKSILRDVGNNDILVILNTRNKHTHTQVSKNFKHTIDFNIDIGTLDYLKLVYTLCLFLFLNKVKYLIHSLQIYEHGIHKYFIMNSSHNIKSQVQLISFNDQPIDISLLLYTLKENNIIKESIVYQHGIIALPQFYFPSKSDKFYAYTKEEKVIDYFNKHNRYDSKLIPVGNLKYQKKYHEVLPKEKKNSALIILGPNWKSFFKTIKVIEKKERLEYKFYLRLHPGMKFKSFAKIITKIVDLYIDESNPISFSPFDIIITEVSTVGFEALAEGYPVAILVGLNYDLQYYFNADCLPKIDKITIDKLQKAQIYCYNNKKELITLLKKFFG